MSSVIERVPLLVLEIEERRRWIGFIEVDLGFQKKQQLPLAAVDVKAKVAGRVASVTVTQKFRNTFKEHLEAVYMFPLSGSCVVSDFELRVGDRIIRGDVKERAQARVEYQQALNEGKRAALLEQERDDVFTMNVGNLPANQEVTVVVTYCERLSYFENGKTELRLPTVVGDRYIAGHDLNRASVGHGTNQDTTAVPDASRITPPRLTKGADADVDLNIEVELCLPEDSGAITDLVCSQHATKIGMDASSITVALAKDNERLNRDFVLQWTLASTQTRSSLLVMRSKDGDYGMLTIMPPKQDGYVGAGRDVLFLIDRSGSMGGIKMVSAVRACSILLNTLGPKDRFAICAFDNTLEWMTASGGRQYAGADPFKFADEAGVDEGLRFLRTIDSRGGTELYSALLECLATMGRRTLSEGRVPALVVLTDGEVGDESRILKCVQQNLNATSLFTIGIDTTVNSGLLKRMSNLGGGTATFVQPGGALESALEAVGREIGTPLVTGLSISGIDTSTVISSSQTPSRVPDLFAGRASTVYFKISGKGPIVVSGTRSDGNRFEQKVKQSALEMPAIGQLWAKSRIIDLEDNYRVTPSDAIKSEIISLSVNHRVLCKFTAYVAIDQKEIVNQDGTRRTIVQPVELPDGWAMYDQGAPAGGAINAPMLQRFLAGGPADGSTTRSKQQSWGAAPAGASGQPSAQAAPPQGAPMPPASPSASGGNAGKFKFDAADALIAREKASNNLQEPGSQNQTWGAPAQQQQGWGESIAESIKRKISEAGGNAGGNAGKPFDSPEQAKAVEAALAKLDQLLSEAFAQLKSGTVADSKALDDAHKALIQALSSTVLGTEVPELQKFLRQAAVELIASLSQSADATSLVPLWQRHMEVWEKARQAACNRLSNPGSTSADDKFWELSV